MSNFVVHILNSVLYTVKAKLYLQKLSKLQWPRGSSAARLLGLRVRIPPEAWMSVSCECRVLSGGGLCDGPIHLPEKSYGLFVCVCVCDQTEK